ncbi:gluconate 5-dehydrogenase/2-deoxy-D-gluconate 3-dehydrogenase [Hydrogenispora ethanolica]|uniref:Gluconate 5-dehydrogenase/2-deoxy-D-gluconate 3-dehydrogenase n=1 Tax=Hydrogenispora ethanolica TaxID=1082276 RepID=A0A4R1R696_HYDET|nr:glucose 1-dehydrogenase [Hydrogenispora ethanolica]TCL60842.1 gluconate 5-dehydrogenase/2-deoxy-D-gluconate 3-dehydrogenase [Hydrogenispora ethanolica]
MESRVAAALEELFSLEGRVGIVTGGSSGLGLAIAKTLAAAGARIYDLSRTPALASVMADDRIISIQTDVTNRPKVERIVAEIAAGTGRIDFLVNNAGMTHRARAESFPADLWERIHEVNLDAVFHLSQIVYPYLKRSEHVGRIVNISSMAGHLGFSEVTPYCSSKAAVIGLTRGLAVEWAGDNIRVNSLAPGWFPSAMALRVMDEERREKILNRMPLHRFGEPTDIGAMALFLVSDAARYITGQDFAVDGGALAFGF